LHCVRGATELEAEAGGVRGVVEGGPTCCTSAVVGFSSTPGVAGCCGIDNHCRCHHHCYHHPKGVEGRGPAKGATRCAAVGSGRDCDPPEVAKAI
jgi:hypothetical protein